MRILDALKEMEKISIARITYNEQLIDMCKNTPDSFCLYLDNLWRNPVDVLSTIKDASIINGLLNMYATNIEVDISKHKEIIKYIQLYEAEGNPLFIDFLHFWIKNEILKENKSEAKANAKNLYKANKEKFFEKKFLEELAEIIFPFISPEHSDFLEELTFDTGDLHDFYARIVNNIKKKLLPDMKKNIKRLENLPRFFDGLPEAFRCKSSKEEEIKDKVNRSRTEIKGLEEKLSKTDWIIKTNIRLKGFESSSLFGLLNLGLTRALQLADEKEKFYKEVEKSIEKHKDLRLFDNPHQISYPWRIYIELKQSCKRLKAECKKDSSMIYAPYKAELERKKLEEKLEKLPKKSQKNKIDPKVSKEITISKTPPKKEKQTILIPSKAKKETVKNDQKSIPKDAKKNIEERKITGETSFYFTKKKSAKPDGFNKRETLSKEIIATEANKQLLSDRELLKGLPTKMQGLLEKIFSNNHQNKEISPQKLMKIATKTNAEVRNENSTTYKITWKKCIFYLAHRTEVNKKN